MVENPPLKSKEEDKKPSVSIHIYSWATPIVGLLMLLIGLAAGYWVRPLIDRGQSPSENNEAITDAVGASANPEQAEIKSLIVAQTRHFIGDESAPVTIIEFSDFQCPYCAKFAAETWPQIYQRYIQTGKVRFGYTHFTILGQGSSWAAEASECAGEQGKFWEYHDLLFNSLAGDKQGFNKERLTELAKELRLDHQKFTACLENGKYTDLVRQQTQFSQSLGVRNTPSFVINDQPLIGAQPFEAFQKIIEEELSK